MCHVKLFIMHHIFTILPLVLCTGEFMETGYKKSQMKNVVNKGTWMRNKLKETDANNDFIFRPNSLDVDNILQSDFSPFNDQAGQNSPHITGYIERSKRSPFFERKKTDRRHIKNSNCKNCNTLINENTYDESKFINKLKPASVFNDYPYEIAVLLDKTRKELERAKYVGNIAHDITKDESSNITIKTLVKENDVAKSNYNVTTENATSTKRSLNYDGKLKIDFDDVNKTELGIDKVDRNIFNKDGGWQVSPGKVSNRFHVLPKQHQKSKAVSERGLIKVLSMLTKTFKKIMRQHDEIKSIHKKLFNENQDFERNVSEMTKKFKDFDIKYLFLIKFNEKLKFLEDRLNLKEQYFKNKESELSKSLIDFENQQKKFLMQQRQFYNIQKLMLAQNEKINLKQNMIAKTQSEISHRQNNFARILKKAKQIYTEKHNFKFNSAVNKLKETNESYTIDDVAAEKNESPKSAESIKINLFSIPTINRVENQDDVLLSEKDEQPIDELIYKYYFNNTFLDNLMRSKILTSFVPVEIASNNPKTKRNEAIEPTTKLLPIVKNVEPLIELTRKRRWINHHSQKKNRHHRGKLNDNLNIEDDKQMKNEKGEPEVTSSSTIILDSITPTPALQVNAIANLKPPMEATKPDPFIAMAKNFCNGIGQNINEQILNWCIEKALRKLRNIDTKIPPPPQILEARYSLKPQRIAEETKTTVIEAETTVQQTTVPPSPPASQSSAPSSTQPSTVVPSVVSPVTTKNSEQYSTNMFFPDNDQLESNLRQYELKPDTEGNVYYDGSIHASELVFDKESGGFSDLMLDQLGSNSRIQVDPLTFDIQARRRAYMRKLKEMKGKPVLYG